MWKNEIITHDFFQSISNILAHLCIIGEHEQIHLFRLKCYLVWFCKKNNMNHATFSIIKSSW